MKILNTPIAAFQKYFNSISSYPENDTTLKLESFSDASMGQNDENINVREDISIFRKNRNSVHKICWTSRTARRVARSTRTDGVLAAVDEIPYMSTILNEGDESRTTELILDSEATLHLCSTAREHQESTNKLILPSIREEHHRGPVAVIVLTPGMTHLADSVTKETYDRKRSGWNIKNGLSSTSKRLLYSTSCRASLSRQPLRENLPPIRSTLGFKNTRSDQHSWTQEFFWLQLAISLHVFLKHRSKKVHEKKNDS